MHLLNIPHPYKVTVASLTIVGMIGIASIGVAVCIEVLRNGPSWPPLPGGPTQTETPPSDQSHKEDAPDKHAGLEQSSDLQLRKLASYEQRLGRGFDRAMVFGDMPLPGQSAEGRAAAMALTLKEYAKQGITPLVVFEPEGLDLRSLDTQSFKRYFTALKANGISDREIGVWVPFPEPNIPEWGDPDDDAGNTDPQLFVKNFTSVATALKEAFPAAQTVVLLDSATYPSHDVAYQHGSYATEALLQYTQGLDRNLVDAAGLQGFPWGERGGEQNYDPAVFLNAEAAIALAKRLAVGHVWLNSGTFSSMHDWDQALRVTVSGAKREQILRGIAKQAERVQQAGLRVTLNVFAEDKSATEANWSYGDPAAWDFFRAVAGDITAKGIGLTIFDPSKAP